MVCDRIVYYHSHLPNPAENTPQSLPLTHLKLLATAFTRLLFCILIDPQLTTMTTLPVSIESETVTLKHEALKTSFKGVVTLPEVVQYRGIKFASIAKRFARSEVVTEYDVDEVDATKSGYGNL